MGELTSIRDIAKQLVDEYNAKHQRDCRLPAPESKPMFDGIDREFLRKMGIDE